MAECTSFFSNLSFPILLAIPLASRMSYFNQALVIWGKIRGIKTLPETIASTAIYMFYKNDCKK